MQWVSVDVQLRDSQFIRQLNVRDASQFDFENVLRNNKASSEHV